MRDDLLLTNEEFNDALIKSWGVGSMTPTMVVRNAQHREITTGILEAQHNKSYQAGYEEGQQNCMYEIKLLQGQHMEQSQAVYQAGYWDGARDVVRHLEQSHGFVEEGWGYEPIQPGDIYVGGEERIGLRRFLGLEE